MDEVEFRSCSTPLNHAACVMRKLDSALALVSIASGTLKGASNSAETS